MKVIEAPEIYVKKSNEVSVFLAGGITKCPDWQKMVITELNKDSNLTDLVVYNPRRSNFDIADPTASEKQIKWEFDNLEKMDIFSMYFVESESVQPICFYELGRNLERMKQRFNSEFNEIDWKQRIIVSYESKFSRASDVEIQTRLALNTGINLNTNYLQRLLIEDHCDAIRTAYYSIKNSINK